MAALAKASHARRDGTTLVKRQLGRGALVCTLVSCALPAGSCGPSVQSIYEGNARFEHCYRLDLDPQTAPSHRQACWKHWHNVYSYGQSRDRLEYARRRMREIEAGDPKPPSLQIEGNGADEQRQFYLSVPAPTSAHEPPPPIATRPYESGASGPPPGDRCVSECRQRHAECQNRCEKRAARANKNEREGHPAVRGEDAQRDGTQRDGTQRDGTQREERPDDKAGEKSEARTRDPAAVDGAGKNAGRTASDAAGSKPDSAIAQCGCDADYKSCVVRCFEE